MNLHSALSQLQNEELADEPQHIVTWCRSIDEILGGGVSRGCVTEVAGESGLGKTQIAFQLCVSVQLPSLLGGLSGKAVFIDTENTFVTNRVAQIATATLQELKTIASKQPVSLPSIDDFLSNIYLFRCLTSVQLLATTHQLQTFVDAHPQVKLVVVDSIANSLRAEEDLRTRTVLLNQLALNFRKLAHNHNVAVLLINQVTTKCNAPVGTFGIYPALGESWSYVAAEKVMLLRNGCRRQALLFKSRTRPRALAEYIVTEGGIRDVGNFSRSNNSYLEVKDTSHLTCKKVSSADKDPNTKVEKVHSGYTNDFIKMQEISKTCIQLSQKQLKECFPCDYSEAIEISNEPCPTNQGESDDTAFSAAEHENVKNNHLSLSPCLLKRRPELILESANQCLEADPSVFEPPKSPVLAHACRKKRKRSSK